LGFGCPVSSAQICPHPDDLRAILWATSVALKKSWPQMALTPLEIRTAKPKAVPYRLADEKGLFLLVQPSGAKLWRLKYRFHKIERKLSLGHFPEVSLKDARDRRDEARGVVEEGGDPIAIRRRARLSAELRAASATPIPKLDACSCSD
jgi:hypothetical protein